MEGQVIDARRALEPEKFPFFDYRRFTFSLGIAARGSVWLSGSTAVCFDVERRSMVVAGDLLAQAGVISRRCETVLAAGQLRLSDIYRVVRYVTPAALPDLGRLNEEQARALGMPRSCSTVVVKSLLRPGALIEIEAVAGIASDSIDYLPSVFAPDGITARDRVQATLGVRGEILRTAEFVTPGTKWSKPRQPMVTSALRIGSPRLSQSGAGAQVDVVVAHGPRVPLVFVSAEGIRPGTTSSTRPVTSMTGLARSLLGWASDLIAWSRQRNSSRLRLLPSTARPATSGARSLPRLIRRQRASSATGCRTNGR